MINYSLFETSQEGKTFIYRSSAGSGKTFALTKAYLKLVLLDTSRYHQVLAITFTNDAKDEMKNRILLELSKLARGENSIMRGEILKDFEKEKVINIKDVLTSRAQTVLNHLLHDYGRFNVSTIDHFFSQLIRQLAKELNLNLGYELDIDNQRALRESVQMLFTKANKNLLEWLKEFSLSQLEDDKGWDIKKNIILLGRKLFNESYLDIEETIIKNADKLDDFIKHLKKKVKAFKEAIITQGAKGVEIAHQYNLQRGDFYRGMPYEQMEKMALRAYDFKKKPPKTFLNALTLDKWHTKSSNRIDDIAKARDAGMKEAHQALVDMYEGQAYVEFIEALAILQYIHSYGVLASLAEKLQVYRSQNNLILISDTAFILNKVISDAEIPFIYEKIGAKYRYILIDEFQDTSFYQWKSLLPFFHNTVTDGGQLLIVGDVKQSIYSWRGGDMKLLLHQVEKDIEVPEENIVNLATNYRSARNIVSFNNAFFKLAPQQLAEIHGLDKYLTDFNKAYNEVEQSSTKEFDGYVNLQLLLSEKGNKWQSQAEQNTLSEVQKALLAGFTLGDMLILTRKTDEASKMARFLLENEISAISEEALLVTSSPKVQLLISALKYLANNEAKLGLAEFNYYYAQVFGQATFSYLEIQPLLKSINALKELPVYEIIEELILGLGIADDSDIYIQQLLDICYLQSRKGNTSMVKFLDWWQEELTNTNSKYMSVSSTANPDAIKIMTIHKAKGLEKPIVFIPYADSSMRPLANSIFWGKPLPEAYQAWGSLPLAFVNNLSATRLSEVYYDEYFKTALESLNLLYVAFTRAVERLYIFSNRESSSPNAGNLLLSVLNNPDFELNQWYNAEAFSFSLGEPLAKSSTAKVQESTAIIPLAGTSPLAGKLAINQKTNRLFLTYNSEKSAKVKEGIALHKAMAQIIDKDSVNIVLKKLQHQQVISVSMATLLKQKIEQLFTAIPQLEDWFSGEYELISERQIFTRGETFIPDRVMIKNNKAIIIDYKREKKDPSHEKQIKNYGVLLHTMGYDPVEMYLIYIDDYMLVKVK